MDEPFIGSEALASGDQTAYALRSRFVAIHRDVYIAKESEITAVVRAKAAWLWSRRRGVVAGRSAAALHGAKWINHRAPAEILHDNRRAPTTIRIWSGSAGDDEVTMVEGLPVTTPERTALDLARRYPAGTAVATIDALARATRLKLSDVEVLAERHSGGRGIRQARTALALVDPGAQSPRETWLRLLLIKAGYPRPKTQIPVYGKYSELVAVLDMGWEEMKIALEYEGDHHRTDRRQFSRDIARFEALSDLGWIAVRVTAGDTAGGILARVATAWSRSSTSAPTPPARSA